MAFKGSERRKSERLDVDLIIKYQIDKPLAVQMIIGKGGQVDARVLDISEGGLGLVTSYDIPKHTLLSMRFTMIDQTVPDVNKTKTVKAAGLVRYNSPVDKTRFRLGVCFTDVSADDKKAIREFIKASAINKRT